MDHGEIRIDPWTVEHTPTIDVWCEYCNDWLQFPTTWTIQHLIVQWINHQKGHGVGPKRRKSARSG